MRTSVLCPLFLAAGCSLYYGTRPACPLPSLRSVAVLPVSGAPAAKEDAFGRILASELLQFPGIERVVLPQEARMKLRVLRLDRRVVQDLRQLARELDTDGVLACELYEFNMHNPPRATLWAALVTRTGGHSDPRLPFRLVREGAPPPSPPILPAGVWTQTLVFDAESHRTADDIVLYSLSREKASYGLSPEERVTRIGSSFFRYMCDRTVRELFYRIKEATPDDRKRNSDRELVHS